LFVDTNVLVYASRRTSQWHAASVTALQRLVGTGEPMRLSRQVLREYLAVTTRPQGASVPLTVKDARADVVRLAAMFELLEDGPATWAQLMALCGSATFAGRQVHDANIVATMLAHGESRLLTYNVGDFTRFQPLIQVATP
jgi:predicted nucleic acid-binding protein